MDFLEKILFIDYTSNGLSSIEQLIFIKISHALSVEFKLNLSAESLCASCGCSKPTLHVSISNLEALGFIFITRSKGLLNEYSLNYEFIDSIVPDFVKSIIETKKMIDDFNAPLCEMKKLTKNQRKRLSKSTKRR